MDGSRIAGVLVIAAVLAATVPGAAAAATILTAGPEMPVTRDGELVPVLGATILPFDATPGDVVFWRDPRDGSPIFFSTDPVGSPHLIGAPIRALSGYSVGSPFFVSVDGQLLLTFAGTKLDDDEPLGFYALPLDHEGQALLEEPERIWTPGPERSDPSPKLVSRGRDALLVWTEQSGSLRTLQLDRDGKLLEWSAPAEQFAARIVAFAVAPVGEGYLLVVTVSKTEGHSASAIPLTGDGQPSGPPVHLFDSPKSIPLRLAGGDSGAFLVWIEEGLQSAILDPSGTVIQRARLVAQEKAPQNISTFSVSERLGGWALAWSSMHRAPHVLSYVEIDTSGELTHRDDLDLENEVSHVSLSYANIPVLAVGIWDRERNTRSLSFFSRHEGSEWVRSTVSSLRPQMLLDVAASDQQIAVLWRDRQEAPSTFVPQVELIGPSGSTEVELERTSFSSPAIVSDDRRFMMTTATPLDVLRSRLDGRWIEPDGEVSQPFLITEEFHASLVQEWSGTEILTYWSDPRPFRLKLIPGDIHVASIFAWGVTASRSFWMADSTGMQDVLCNEIGCIAAWNDQDLSGYCDFCDIPSRSLVGLVNRNGDLVSPPTTVAEEWRTMLLAPTADSRVLFSRTHGDELVATLVDRDAQSLSSIQVAEIARGSQFTASALADAAVVAWEADGDIMARLVTGDGSLGALSPLAASDAVERNPHLIVAGSATFLLYERIVEEAGFVPRLFIRQVSEVERRRPVMRRRAE